MDAAQHVSIQLMTHALLPPVQTAQEVAMIVLFVYTALEVQPVCCIAF